MAYKFIDGSVTVAKGFKASGIHCGIRKNKTKRDIALIYSEVKCTAAAVYTTNLVQSSPITVTKKNLADGYAQAVIVNSGNANTCNADGIEKAEMMCQLVADKLDISAEDVIVGSTGVIGQILPIEPIADGMAQLVSELDNTLESGANAAEAIMTTDTVKKEVAVETEIDGKIVRIGGISKGSGMIHPNMATMLNFITTDAAISQEMLDLAFKKCVGDSFNMITVDGDQSTNDMAVVLANGEAKNEIIDCKNAELDKFKDALMFVMQKLARDIAKQIESELEYPGQVKVSLIRESRVVDYAK